MSSSIVVDPFICVGIAILVIVTMVVNVYIYAYWQHPDDKNQSYIPKALIILGLELSSFAVLMIPIDVANNAGNPICGLEHTPPGAYCGGIDFVAVWEALFCFICFFVVVLIPFATFYYESEFEAVLDPTHNTYLGSAGRICVAIQYTSVIVVAFLITLVPLYFSKGVTTIPVETTTFNLADLPISTYKIDPPGNFNPYNFIPQEIPSSTFHTQNIIGTTTSIEYNVNFAVYLIGLFGWIGYWAFSLFAGVGLTALPFDLICAFIWRPIMLAPDQIAERELKLQEMTTELVDIGEMMKRDRISFIQGGPGMFAKRKRAAEDRIEINKLTQMVYNLEKEVEEVNACKHSREQYNPLVPYAYLMGGMFFALISSLWIVQIILYMIPSPPIHQFLNIYLIWFDSWFPMFGNISYALFSLYLLFATVKGCFKVGVRFCCLKIHPMEVGKTYINSFLFNLAVILVCTNPIISFCTEAFGGYARSTDAFFIFNVQIQYLNFYSTFQTNHVFVWILLLTALIQLPYFFMQPRDRPPSSEALKSSLQRRGAGYSGLPGMSSDHIMDSSTPHENSHGKSKRKSGGGGWFG